MFYLTRLTINGYAFFFNCMMMSLFKTLWQRRPTFLLRDLMSALAVSLRGMRHESLTLFTHINMSNIAITITKTRIFKYIENFTSKN